MKKVVYFIGVIGCLFLIGCHSPENPVRGADYQIIEAFPLEKQLSGEKLDTVPMGASWIYMVDTFFVFKIKNQQEMISVWDARSLKHRGNMLSRGGGPNEMTGVTYMKQYSVISGKVMMPILDMNRSRYIHLDLTTSLEKGEAVLDDSSLVHVDGIYISVFDRGDSSLVGVKMDYDNQRLVYQGISKKDGRADGSEYASIDGLASPDDLQFLYTINAMKPSGDKMVSAMTDLNQINIIDLEHPEQTKSVVYGKTTDIEKLRVQQEDNRIYYNDVIVTDSLIYALYLNIPKTMRIYENPSSEIHVFDWEGNPVCRYKLDLSGVNSLAINEDKKNIYVLRQGDDPEEVYKCRI